jgi:hypothetical protein
MSICIFANKVKNKSLMISFCLGLTVKTQSKAPSHRSGGSRTLPSSASQSKLKCEAGILACLSTGWKPAPQTDKRLQFI